jgi:hypothetical protein
LSKSERWWSFLKLYAFLNYISADVNIPLFEEGAKAAAVATRDKRIVVFTMVVSLYVTSTARNRDRPLAIFRVQPR